MTAPAPTTWPQPPIGEGASGMRPDYCDAVHDPCRTEIYDFPCTAPQVVGHRAKHGDDIFKHAA